MVEANDLKPRRQAGVASRLFNGEAVLIDPAQNKVRMLNPVGSRIWELADGSRTLAEIIDTLVAEFEVEPAQAAASVRAFVEELVARELLTW